MERQIGSNHDEHGQRRGLNIRHLDGLARQGHADEQCDGGDRRWQEGVHRSQSLHVDAKGKHAHERENLHVDVRRDERILTAQRRRSLRCECDDNEQRRHHAEVKREQSPRERLVTGIVIAAFIRLLCSVERTHHEQHAAPRKDRGPPGFQAVSPSDGESDQRPRHHEGLRPTLMTPQPGHDGVGKKQCPHAAQHAQRCHPVGTSDGQERNAREHKSEVPEVEGI